MAGVLDKIRKRKAYPVTLPNGEEIHIRQMSMGEHVRRAALTGDANLGFMVGCILAEDNGDTAYSKKPEESDAEFGLRVATDCELDPASFHAIQEAVKKLEKVPSQEVLIKNSEETSTQT
jgi:hypothetical protein